MAARTPHTWPWLAIGVTILAALLTTSDAASAWATATRIPSRELGLGWQAWTTHGVHVSALHLLGSGLVWLMAGAAVERISRGSLIALILAGAPAITWAALVAEPEMGSYVGLSGLACACVAWLACAWLWSEQSHKRTRLLGAILLMAVGIRIGCDLLGNGRGWGLALNEATAGDSVRVARYAHLAGALAGALIWFIYSGVQRAGLRHSAPATIIPPRVPTHPTDTP